MTSTLDTNLCAGFHDTGNLGVNNGFDTGRTVTLAADGKTLTTTNSEGGGVTLYRQTP